MQYSRIEYFAKCRKVEYESISSEHKVSSEQRSSKGEVGRWRKHTVV